MVRFTLCIALLVVLFTPGEVWGQSPDEVRRSLGKVVQKAAAQVAPSVVQIQVTRKKSPTSKSPSPPRQPMFAFPPEYFRRPPGPVTGLIIDSTGWVLTSHYNVFQASKIQIFLSDGRSYPADIRGIDVHRDLALLKIDPKGTSLPVVSLSSQTSAQTGQIAVVVGRGRKLSSTSVDWGIISGTQRLDGDFLQFDGKLNYANVGGPIVDIRGRVLGVTSRISHQRRRSPMGQNSGVAFAVPVEVIQKILPQLKQGKTIHHPPPAFLGVVFRPPPPGVFGLQAKQVLPSSPAHKAGMKKGDILISLEGIRIVNYYQLLLVLKKIQTDEDLPMIVQREGKKVLLQVKMNWLSRRRQKKK